MKRSQADTRVGQTEHAVREGGRDLHSGRGMTRRETLGLLAIAASGCASKPAPTPAPPDRRPRLPPVHVSAAREIRTVVGLRPFRPSGFVVRAEKLGEKLVVHNYGHGGGGVTLSWGTADLATRLALESGARRMAVLGCGAVGLATARLLQERGAEVSIYAAALPPETTSNIAGAQCFPFTVFERGALVGAFRDQFISAARFSYLRYQSLVGPRAGVRWMTNYICLDEPIVEDSLLGRESPIRDLIPELADLSPDENPFPRRFVRRLSTMMIEPATYLPALLADVRLAGGSIAVRRFASVAELATLPEPVIINCTGLGAAELFGDPELQPIKGQLTVLLPQPEVDYAVLAGQLYMFARSDGILLGGTHERGVYTLEPNLEAKRELLAGHARFFAGMARPARREIVR
jgi:D-amino-acid oxidase